jgi:hypothetical protein
MVALDRVRRQAGLRLNPQSHNFDHGAAAKKPLSSNRWKKAVGNSRQDG